MIVYYITQGFWCSTLKHRWIFRHNQELTHTVLLETANVKLDLV